MKTFDGLACSKTRSCRVNCLVVVMMIDNFLSKRVKFGTFKACFHVLMDLVKEGQLNLWKPISDGPT